MMNDLIERMEQSRTERITRVRLLNQNTIQMRLLANQAHRDGLSGYRIAKLLGVTTRTVYLWLGR